MSSLQDLYIADSYDGLLHAGGEPIGATGKSKIYDGSGQETALSLGLDGNGATVSGSLSTSDLKVGELTFPKVGDTVGSVVVQVSPTELGLTDELPSSILADLVPSPEGTYTGISSLTVNSKGQVTEVNESSADDDFTITKTVYKYSTTIPSKVQDEFEIDTSWRRIDLRNVVPSTAKAVILAIRLSTNNLTDIANIRYCNIQASPNDGEDVYQALYWTGEDMSIGPQFSCPIGKSGNARNIYFRIKEAGGGDAPLRDPQTWDVYIVAYQE
jgi:hypothetical protein